jgi:multidrug resistance protein, MATE family
VLLWGLGLAGGYLLAYGRDGIPGGDASPADFWLTSSVALALTASLFVLILWQAARRQSPTHPAPSVERAADAARARQEKSS